MTFPVYFSGTYPLRVYQHIPILFTGSDLHGYFRNGADVLMLDATVARSLTASSFPLVGRDVKIWVVTLDARTEVVESLVGNLCDDERERAARFRFPRDGIRFALGRALLRMIIGEHLQVSPRLLRFAYGPCGKPRLAAPFDQSGIQFNASYSADLGLYAITQAHPVGVDNELLRPIRDLDATAKQAFSPHEQETFRRLPPGQRLQGFFNCWTRKEAFVKAIGDGLGHPLARFTVSFAPDESARVIDVEGDSTEASRWTLQALELQGYTAAIALRVGHCKCSAFAIPDRCQYA